MTTPSATCPTCGKPLHGFTTCRDLNCRTAIPQAGTPATAGGEAQPIKLKTIDEVCGQPAGTFKQMREAGMLTERGALDLVSPSHAAPAGDVRDDATPETDAAEGQWGGDKAVYYVPSTVCRSLERQRNAAREHAGALEEGVRELTQQRDVAREACKISSGLRNAVGKQRDEAEAQRDTALLALLALKPFAELYGSLEGVGGGTEVKRVLKLQWVKDALAALAGNPEVATLAHQLEAMKLKWESEQPGKPGTYLRAVAKAASDICEFNGRSDSLATDLREHFEKLTASLDRVTAALKEAERQYQAAYDCHGAGCGKCISCLMAERDAARAESKGLRNPRIYTHCPSCGKDTLTINEDKHLICTWIDCKDPTLIDRIESELTTLRQIFESVEQERDKQLRLKQNCIGELERLRQRSADTERDTARKIPSVNEAVTKITT